MNDVTAMLQDIRMSLQTREGEADREMVFRGTTEGVARDGGVLRMDGMNADEFDKNPVVLWQHNMAPGNNVIGRVTKRELDTEAKAWDFTVQFAPEGSSELADQVYRLTRAGFIKAASVGFRVREFENLTAEQREQEGLPPGTWVGARWDLHELSIVPVGSDPDALARSVEQGELQRGDVDALEAGLMRRAVTLEPATPPQEPMPLETAEQLQRRMRDLTQELQRLGNYTGQLVVEMRGLRDELRDSALSESDAEPGGGEEPMTPGCNVHGHQEDGGHREAALKDAVARLSQVINS